MWQEILLLLSTVFITVNCNYCTQECKFSLSFHEPFQVPASCSTTYGTPYITCLVDIQIDYARKKINVQLYASDNIITGNDMYQMDINGSFHQHNQTLAAELKYQCVFTDDCAKNYTRRIFPILLSHQTILHKIKDRVYNHNSSNVQRCYDLQNKTIDCINGQCRAEVGIMSNPNDTYNPLPFYKTYCNYYPSEDPFHNATGFVGTYTYGVPPEFGVFNNLHFVCNRNLCNNNKNIKLIQNLVNDFNNFTTFK